MFLFVFFLKVVSYCGTDLLVEDDGKLFLLFLLLFFKVIFKFVVKTFLGVDFGVGSFCLFLSFFLRVRIKGNIFFK